MDGNPVNHYSIEFYPKVKSCLQQAAEITEGIKRNDFINADQEISDFDKEMIDDMVRNFSARFDTIEGGTKGAPKFPMPTNYLFLLRYYARTKGPEILEHVLLTLQKMAAGGIYDQVGGGFARYSVDEHWHIPHFEKMLYDNAQLVSLYSEAYQLTRKETYKHVIAETLEFIQREMTNPEGGFYSAIDADSEGEEGKFYVWEKQEFSDLLGSDADIAIDYFGVNKDAYWENGKNVLIKANTLSSLAEKFSKSEDDIRRIISESRKKLLEKGSERIRPGLDDKILTSWNALMLKGYSDAYSATGEKNYLDTALKNAEFLHEKLQNPEGGYFRTYKNGKSVIPGFLDDQAFLIEAFISLYQVTFDEQWINEARRLMDFTINRFYNEQKGLFSFNQRESNELFTRKFELMDNVIPSSNSSIANSLFLLSQIYEMEKYKKTAEKMLSSVKDKMVKYPSAFSNWGILAMNISLSFLFRMCNRK